MSKYITCSQNHQITQDSPYWIVYIHKILTKDMSSGSHPRSQNICSECDASFFSREGLEKHFQKQHGVYCESCPIDTAVQ